MARSVTLSIFFVLACTLLQTANAEGLWVANQARYECDDNNDGSTSRVVACVPSNNLGGKEYAIGASWKDTEYKYQCIKTYPMQLALKKVGCVTPNGEELQPGNSTTIADKGQYNCVLVGGKDKEVFLDYKAGCFYNNRFYASEETFRNGDTVLGCKANGQDAYAIKAVGCISNEKAVPIGEVIKTGTGAYSKCQVQANNATSAAMVPATEKEYNDWLASSAHTTMAVPTTVTTPKTTTTLATIPTRTTTKAPRDCKDKHPMCADLCAYPCFEDPTHRGRYPVFNNVARPVGNIIHGVVQYPGVVINSVNQAFLPPQPSWTNPRPGNPWWQVWSPTTKRPRYPWEDDMKGGETVTKPQRPAAGLCRIWTSLGKEGVEKMCPKSCKVIGCKYELVNTP